MVSEMRLYVILAGFPQNRFVQSLFQNLAEVMKGFEHGVVATLLYHSVFLLRNSVRFMVT